MVNESSWGAEVNRQLSEHGGRIVELRRDIDELKHDNRNMANELREIKVILERNHKY